MVALSVSDYDGDVRHTGNICLMLDCKSAGIGCTPDRQGDIRRQNQIRIVAGNCDARAGGGVVDERSGSRVGIGNGKIDCVFCSSYAIDKVNLVGKCGENTRSVIGCFYYKI